MNATKCVKTEKLKGSDECKPEEEMKKLGFS